MSKVSPVRPLEGIPSAPPAAAPVVVPEALRVDLVVLSDDLELFKAVRESVGERNPVWRARSAEETADLLIAGHCGVLLIDLAAVSARPDSLIEQIVDQFPDVVVCVAGSSGDETQLASLISEGLVYRFMHKPATPRRAGMFMQAAIRRHAERREGEAGRDPLLPILRGLARPRTGVPRKYFAWLAIACVLVVLPLFIDGTPDPPAPVPAVATLGPAAAVPTTAPVAADNSQRADPVLSRARAALQAGRLERPAGRNALDLFQAVLLAEPDQAEARQGLARTLDLLLAEAARQASAGNSQEAERVLRRVLAIEPQHAAARALEQRINPPDTLSPRVERQQVAAARPLVPVTTAAAAPVAVATAARTTPATPVTVTRGLAKPRPDPLAPGHISAPRRTTLARTSSRSYGAPITNALPTAGLAAPPELAVTVAPEPVTAPGIVAADEFDRVAARSPVYPLQALRDRTRGWVELEFTIMSNGTVRDIAVVGAEPTGVFEGAAADALADWRFRPRVVNGQPVAQRSTITMRFDVDG